MYTYLLLHSLHFIINALLFSSTVQYWALWVTALYQIMSYWCTFLLLPCPHTIKDIRALISIMGTKTSISQSKQVIKLYSYSELIIHLVKQLNLSVQSSSSHSYPQNKVIMVWMWLLDNQGKGTVDRAWSGLTATVKWESWEIIIQEMWIRCRQGDTVCSIHTHSHTCTSVCAHHTHTLYTGPVCVCVCVCVCVYICIHTRIHIYIHTHTHTHTHTHAHHIANFH